MGNSNASFVTARVKTPVLVLIVATHNLLMTLIAKNNINCDIPHGVMPFCEFPYVWTISYKNEGLESDRVANEWSEEIESEQVNESSGSA